MFLRCEGFNSQVSLRFPLASLRKSRFESADGKAETDAMLTARSAKL